MKLDRRQFTFGASASALFATAWSGQAFGQFLLGQTRASDVPARISRRTSPVAPDLNGPVTAAGDGCRAALDAERWLAAREA